MRENIREMIFSKTMSQAYLKLSERLRKEAMRLNDGKDVDFDAVHGICVQVEDEKYALICTLERVYE